MWPGQQRAPRDRRTCDRYPGCGYFLDARPDAAHSPSGGSEVLTLTVSASGWSVSHALGLHLGHGYPHRRGAARRVALDAHDALYELRAARHAGSDALTGHQAGDAHARAWRHQGGHVEPVALLPAAQPYVGVLLAYDR